MNPGPAISMATVWGGGLAVSSATRDSASFRGLPPACLAFTKTTLVDQSPCSRRAGRSRKTSLGSTATSKPASAATLARARLMDDIKGLFGDVQLRRVSLDDRKRRRKSAPGRFNPLRKQFVADHIFGLKSKP